MLQVLTLAFLATGGGRVANVRGFGLKAQELQAPRVDARSIHHLLLLCYFCFKWSPEWRVRYDPVSGNPARQTPSGRRSRPMAGS